MTLFPYVMSCRHAAWDAGSKKLVGHFSEDPFGFKYWSGKTNDVKICESFSIKEMKNSSASKRARGEVTEPFHQMPRQCTGHRFSCWRRLGCVYADIENYKLH